MKSESWLAIQIGVVLFLLAIGSFVWTPAYEKGVWCIITVFAVQFGNIMGVKSGRSMPQQVGDQKPGQTSEIATKTDTVAPPQG